MWHAVAGGESSWFILARQQGRLAVSMGRLLSPSMSDQSHAAGGRSRHGHFQRLHAFLRTSKFKLAPSCVERNYTHMQATDQSRLLLSRSCVVRPFHRFVASFFFLRLDRPLRNIQVPISKNMGIEKERGWHSLGGIPKTN
jgi:hypothetical protein